MNHPDTDPRISDNARYGADPRVRAIATAAAAGVEVDLTDEHPAVLRHVALALSMLAALRAATHAPARLDMCTWRIEAGTLTFAPQPDADWLDEHVARLIAAAAAGTHERDLVAWFDLWDAAPAATKVPLVLGVGRAAHAPLVVDRHVP